MTTALAPDDHFGPAMSALNPRQQKFVIAILDNPGIDNSAAAKVAGYEDPVSNPVVVRVQGHRLAHNVNVQAAMREEAVKRMNSGAIRAISTILEICADKTEKASDRLAAAKMIAQHVGLLTNISEHKVTVEHTVNDQAMLTRIRQLAEFAGVDARKLLGSAGVVVDAEFQVVEDEPVIRNPQIADKKEVMLDGADTPVRNIAAPDADGGVKGGETAKPPIPSTDGEIQW